GIPENNILHRLPCKSVAEASGAEKNFPRQSTSDRQAHCRFIAFPLLPLFSCLFHLKRSPNQLLGAAIRNALADSLPQASALAFGLRRDRRVNRLYSTGRQRSPEETRNIHDVKQHGPAASPDRCDGYSEPSTTSQSTYSLLGNSVVDTTTTICCGEPTGRRY